MLNENLEAFLKEIKDKGHVMESGTYVITLANGREEAWAYKVKRLN